jgi:hypothetical protein
LKKKSSFRSLALAGAIALGATLAGCAMPQKPSVEVGDVVELSGKVVAVQRAARTVSVQGPQGNVVVVKVGQAARNFDQIRVGDVVKLTYYESVAIFVTSDGMPPEADATVMVAAAPKGAMPAGEAVQVTDVSATIQSINPVRRVLMLKGPQGNVFPVTVDRSVRGFEALRVGDNVHVRHTEAIAVTVSKP